MILSLFPGRRQKVAAKAEGLSKVEGKRKESPQKSCVWAMHREGTMKGASFPVFFAPFYSRPFPSPSFLSGAEQSYNFDTRVKRF